MSIEIPMAPETPSAEPPFTRSTEVRDTVRHGEVRAAVQRADGQLRSTTSDTTVVITEAEVLFSTAAATGLQRKDRDWITVLRRIFVVSQDDSRPKRRNPPPRIDFLEESRMAREMLRL
jgi:hypothetical protein